ncbi:MULTISPECIES: patatin-like phospholipase family protein [Roseivirga]|uniref:patatin-like phospholipase family protein n=1 Tax=Roseivirga TaxID=290180 RepID=UPI00257F4D4B|nr:MULTISPECIES: patatin-like phospholipase family protein [Roseivirga]MEC7754452.1 patatin-like phospholipase family protein [Bacteroidota bacterium]|tara:strand:+ start:9131 stop:11446 length:2316 start_codon:yes stop_codon:yes gene_type:complete
MKRACVIGLIFLCSNLLAQQQKVGLVLSGGGAKGLAHIGVIKALEENHIPIDYIVGTSMGAVVGAFYAAGYSPDEIEMIVKDPAFQNWVQGTSTERYQYNYTRAEDNASWISLDLILDPQTGPQLNTPLANDLIINFVLNEYLSQAAQASGFNFNKLLVPYRAIAADVFTQRTLALDSGSLMKAVRSSMAVPFFYRPIKNENQYLFDGGIYDNFPVDIMKEHFAPDVVIGSNVATKLSETYPFDKDEEILNDALLFMFLDKTDPSVIKEGDVYLEPSIEQYTAVDFDKVEALIDSGYSATIRSLPELRQKVQGRRDPIKLTIARRDFHNAFKPYSFGELKLFGFTTDQQKFIRKLIDFDDGPQSITQVSRAYFQLVSEPYFKHIYPNFAYNETNGQYVLELYLKPTAKNSLTIDFGGNISTRQVSTLQVGAELNSFNKKLNTYRMLASTGRFYESLNLATRFNVNPKTRFFVEPNFQYNHWDYLSTEDFFDESVQPLVLDRIDRRLGVVLGIGTGQRSVVTLEDGLLRNRDAYSNTPGVSSDALLDRLELTGFRSKLAYERNSLNKKQFATVGSRFYASLKYINATFDYMPGSTSTLYNPSNPVTYRSGRSWLTFQLSFEEYSQVTSRYTFGWMVESSYSTIRPLRNYHATQLYVPSFEPMFDSKTFFLEDFRAPGYVATGMRHLYGLGRSLSVRAELYAFVPYRQIADVNQEAVVDVGFVKPRIKGMLAFVYEAIPGPISLRLNYIEGNSAPVGLMLSFGYLIFNQKSHD